MCKKGQKGIKGVYELGLKSRKISASCRLRPRILLPAGPQVGTLQIPHFSIPQRSMGCCGASGNRQNLAQGEWVQGWGEPWISSDPPVSGRDAFASGLFSSWLVSVENWKIYFRTASVSSSVK